MAYSGLVAHPVIDHGGTNCRVGWVSRMMVNGRFTGTPKLISSRKFKTPLNKSTGQPDLAASLTRQKQVIEELTPKNVKIMKVVCGSFPGAWLGSGYVYRNTVNSNRELEGVHLSSRLSKIMGKGWHAVINNDGVAQALAISQGLVANMYRFPQVQKAMGKTGKIVALIPGTGLAGGAFIYKRGRLFPVPGPQQFFDIAIEAGDGVIDPNHRYLSSEDFASGVGMAFHARKSFLSERYPKENLSTQNFGQLLYRLAFSKAKSIRADEREFALALYRYGARGIAKTMQLINEGPVEGERRKLIVNDPPSLEAKFWKGVKGTRVFVLGGWLTDPKIKGYISRALRDELDSFGVFKPGFIFADDIPGIQEMVKDDSAGLIGAALLVNP